MKTRTMVAASTLLACAIGAALFLRPTRSIPRGPELAAPERIPPAARAVIASKMRRHAQQLPVMLSEVVVLDYDGVARSAGEIFDEPQIARPLTGDELNGLLPERFFVLQDALRTEARQVVEAAARGDDERPGAVRRIVERGPRAPCVEQQRVSRIVTGQRCLAETTS